MLNGSLEVRNLIYFNRVLMGNGYGVMLRKKKVILIKNYFFDAKCYKQGGFVEIGDGN
jgi:hypothetical protein